MAPRENSRRRRRRLLRGARPRDTAVMRQAIFDIVTHDSTASAPGRYCRDIEYVGEGRYLVDKLKCRSNAAINMPGRAVGRENEKLLGRLTPCRG